MNMIDNEHEKFLEKLLVHNLYYKRGTFEVVGRYVSDRKKLLVRDKYGEMEVLPYNLLLGKKPAAKSALNKTQYFINKSNDVHNYYCLYDRLIFTRKKDYIEVGCPVHGYFTVRADHHEAGIKCRNCNQGNPLGVFNKKNANNHKDKWLNIDAWLYFLEIFNGKDYFYKVGIVTKEDINNRLKEFPKHFQVNLLYFEKGNLYNHTYSEAQIIEDFSMFQYNPKEDFRGKKECFSVNPLEYYYENFNITDENNEQQF